MDRRRAAGVLLVLAACVAYATAAPTASNHTTSLDLYDGAPEGCYYNFQHYGEGDRIMTNEPCLNCTCHNRMLMCYLRVCPFTKPIGQDCTIEKRADQCCPIVTCPDVPVDLLTSTTTSPAEYGATGLGKLEKFGCSIHGKYFPEGSKVPPTPNKPCEHCYCIRNMTTCVMQECTLHVDGCTPIYHKDVCCPVRYSCDHPEDEMPLLDDLSTTVRPTPGFMLTPTTLSPVTQMSQDCLYENQVIRDGALIKTEKACDHCYCMKGDIVCVVQECGTPMENEGKNCTALAPREGVCCPDTYICEGDEPTTGTYETDYTTELQKISTLSPPRRAGSEGSGYRNEPDGIPNTELPTFETETEGSGYEQATIHPATVIDTSPDSHETEPSDDISPSTFEPNKIITITTTEQPISDHVDVTTERDVHEDNASQQPTTSTYISSPADESITKAQDEDIGSGEEDIETPYDSVPSSSELPAVEDSEPTVTSEQNVATTKSSKEDDSETPVKEPTTTAPIVDEEKTSKPKEQSEPIEDSFTDITTEAHRHLGEDEAIESSTIFDEENHITEHDLLQTTSIPIIDENEIKSTASSPVHDKTFDPQHYSTSSTNAPGFEDEISTTESQDDITDSFEGTAADIDVHHLITMTASTPLLEEIENEKDTIDQEIPNETTPDKVKSSTTSSILPTEESIDQDILKPDLIDETISTNIPTTVPEFENDVKPTADQQIIDAEDSSKQQFTSTTSAPVVEDESKISTPTGQESQETDIEESSEPQQHVPTTSAPVFDDQRKQTSLSDVMTTTKAQEDHDTEVEESSKPQKYTPTTSAPVLYDETKETTPSVSLTTSKTQETGFEESSEPQQYEPTTSASIFDDETKQTPSSDAMTTANIDEVQEADVKESSEPQEYAPTTTAPVFDDETKQTIPSDSMTTTNIHEGQETDVKESSKPEQYVPTTSSPAFEDEVKKATPSDTDADESSEPQQYDSTTSAPIRDEETKQTTLSDVMTTAKSQDVQDKEVDDSSEHQQHVPTTSASVHDDESKQTTLSDAMTTAKSPEIQDKDVEDSSEPQQHASTASAPVHDDETKQTTLSDDMTTDKTQGQDTLQESSGPDRYVPTTSAPVFEDEIRISTPADSITTSKIQESQETDVDDESPKPQYVPTTSAPVFEDDTQITTISDAMSTSRTQEGEESSEAQQYTPTTSAPAFDEENKKSTAEPDKGLNTIPSGPVEEETTESPETEKHSHTDETVTIESATEHENKINDVTEVITDTAKHTTLLPDISAMQEDQLKQTTDSTVKENDDKIISTETHDIDEQKTTLGDISEEATSTPTHDESKLPATDYQESSTSPVPLSTENKEQTSDSGKPITTSTYEYSTQVSEAEDKTPEKQEITTSSPSYTTVPASTTADLEENEIFNEPRIPGEGDCLLNGVTYRNESTVPNINKCRSGCRCISSIIKCDPIICSPPPEYMDNCQTTYDSLDSCCPTYVCDHKTETIPPKPHSQMSGTEAPVESPVKCNGDECVLSEDKTKPVDSSDLCESGSCTNEDESTTHPSNIPEQHAVDRNEECTGDKCTSSGSTDQLCTEENGCQASPVKPCEGSECEVTSVALPPEQPPCTSGNCDVPVKDCSGSKCAPDEDDKHEIDRECTEKSCKRKDDSELGQEPPKICSGSECQSTEHNTDGEMELTTDDILDIVTEKTETSSASPSTEITQGDIVSKPKDEISVYESTTLSANQESPLPETTKVIDDEIVTENPTNLPDVYETEKPEYDVTTKVSYKDTESPDLSADKESTTEAAEEIKTLPPKIDSTEKQEVTKVPQKIDSSDETTYSSDDKEQQSTQPPVKPEPENAVTSILEEMVTKPPKTHDTGLSEADDDAISTEQSEDKNDDATTKTSAVSAIEDVTKLPQLSDEFTTSANEDTDSTTSKSVDSDSHKTSKPPQVTTASEDTTTQIIDIISAETLKPLVTELEEITKAPIESQDEGTTSKSTDEFVTQPEITDVQDTTISSDGIDKITKHHLEETSTESSKLFETEVTKLPERTYSETTTTSITEDLKTEASKPSDSDIQEVTQSSKETSIIAEETGTETSKPLDTELQATTPSSEETEKEEATKKSTITEPSLVSETDEQKATKSPEVIEPTTTEVIEAESYTEQSKYDEISHETTKPQQDFETEVTVSQIKNETISESSKPDESELSGTTKSPSADFDSEETTAKVTKGTDKEPTSDNLEPESVTQSSESYSVALPEITTTKSLEDDQQLSSESHSLENSSTTQPDTVSEITTQSMPLPDSKSTETERTVIYEMTTRIPEQKQPTEFVDELPIMSSESPIHKDDDITSISDSEVTPSPSKPNEDGTTTGIEIDTDTSDKTVTELSQEQDTETPDEVKKTTEPATDLDEMTQRPTITSDDDKFETEINTVSEKTTSKPSDTTDTFHVIDVITEQPETSDYPKEEEQSTETLDNKTEPSILEKTTTKSPLESDTKLPIDAEQEPERHTEKPYIHEQEPDTSGKDESITETPQVNELTTVNFEDKLTEKATEIDKELETTQNENINTKPTESEDETYTKRPLQSSSEATDIEASHTSKQSDDTELTTPTIKISVPTTEPSNILQNTPTESSDTYNVDTEKESETTQKESLATEVTEKTIIESSSIKDDTEDKETQTMIPDISTVQESSTKGQPQEAETLEKDITTARSVVTETEKIYEPITESVKEVTMDTEVKTPEQAFEPSQPTITESAEHMTNAQDQGENIDVVTEITATKDSDSTPTSPSIIQTTKVPEAIETSTESLDMITSLPGDTETSTRRHELPEATTSGKTEDERDMQTTEIPIMIPELQPVEIVTEPQPVLIDTTTRKQTTGTEIMEEEFIPSKPEMQSTTISVIEDITKSTPSPVEDASIASEQTLSTSIEPHITEEEQSATTMISDLDKATTPKIPEIEVQTEKETIPTESPLQPEQPPVTTAPEEEEKLTTAKVEELSTASPVFDKFTKPIHKPTEAPATEQPRPISTEEPTDDLLTPDEEPSIPPSGTSGYGTEPDYMEEDQTFGPGTCRYGGKVYVSAQQIPRDDPCDFCFCFRSDIICLQQSCPPPIHGCHEEPISGFCCPRYECPVSMATTVNVTTTTTTTTTTLPPHFPVHSYKGSAQKRGCLIKGHTYKVGEVVRASSGPCLHCTCGGDGQMKCDPKQCTPEPMLRQMIAAAVSAKRRR